MPNLLEQEESRDGSVMIFREHDGYLQFMSSEGATPDMYAHIQRTPEQREEDRQSLIAVIDASLEELKVSPEPSIYYSHRDGDTFIGSDGVRPLPGLPVQPSGAGEQRGFRGPSVQ
ncbi:hypothetical protein [Marinobacter sp. LQ44]|uniref:hypothetical protein n=1 Tax=unclassified Marinobacter TaxID=83889 RepID=UPI000718FDC7|nr:hypothetical protein [Marinobacter sp. LQ44]AMQ90264.1 hypothetical protein ASQ50_17055 [Marinobacter sp. LQ44]